MSSLLASGASVYLQDLTVFEYSSMVVTDHLASLIYAGRNDPSALPFKFCDVKSSPLLGPHQFLYPFNVHNRVLRSRRGPGLKNFICDVGSHHLPTHLPDHEVELLFGWLTLSELCCKNK